MMPTNKYRFHPLWVSNVQHLAKVLAMLLFQHFNQAVYNFLKYVITDTQLWVSIIECRVSSIASVETVSMMPDTFLVKCP